MKKIRILIIYSLYGTFLINGLTSQNLTLIVSGNTVNETTVIDSIGYKKSFSNFKLLQEEIINLKENLQKIGFIENKIVSTKKENDSTYHSKIRLGEKYHTIYIYYDKNTISIDFLKSLIGNTNESFFETNIETIPSLLTEINAYLIENGYPFSTVKLDFLKKSSTNKSLNAELVIESNSERTIDKVIVKGYENFPKSYLKHYLKLKPEKALNINTLKEKVKILNSLPFTSLTREPEILFTKDSSTVYLYLQKRKSNIFDGFLGFGTNETSGKLEFDGYLDLTLNNNLNYGESINIIYKSDENEQKTFNANLKAPYIFNSPLGAELDLEIFKKDSTFTTVSQSANLFYQINNQQILYTGLTSIQSNNLIDGNPLLNIEDYNSTFYNLQYQILKPQYNNLLFTNNFILDAKVGFGSRKNNNQKANQSYYEVNAYKIFNLNIKNSIFFRANSQGIQSEDYFTNELLRFGGINSIRGFEENSLLATLYAFLNLEYRYNLSPSVYVHTITDAAYLNNSLENYSEKLYGFGFGLGVLTKAGVLRLNYAIGKSEDQKFEFSNSKMHLSLNAKF
ncbi:hypothetical protein MWU50_00510 [Flavobacteriaceae bacterium S0862]|nr:hypothetical protein [Flavobacteriaceae bacterium S0862]